MEVICLIVPRKASHSFSLVAELIMHSDMLAVIQRLQGHLYVFTGSSVAHKHSLISVFDCMSIGIFRDMRRIANEHCQSMSCTLLQVGSVGQIMSFGYQM